MWVRGPLSPVRKAMGSQEGKSCTQKKKKGGRFYCYVSGFTQSPCSLLLFFNKRRLRTRVEDGTSSTRSFINLSGEKVRR